MKQELKQLLESLKNQRSSLSKRIAEIEKPKVYAAWKEMDRFLKEKGWKPVDGKDYRYFQKDGIEVFNCPHLCSRIHFSSIDHLDLLYKARSVGKQKWIGFAGPETEIDDRLLEAKDFADNTIATRSTGVVK